MIEFSSVLKIPKIFFLILGLSLFEDSIKSKTRNCWYYAKIVYFWMQNITLTLCLASEITELILTWKYSKDFFKTVETITYISFPIITQSKLLIIYLYRDRLNSLIHALKILFPKTRVEQEQDNLPVYIKKINFIITLFAILYTVFIWAFNLLPLVDSFMIYQEINIWKPQMPFHFWYPFDVYQPWIFEINYIFQIWNSSNSTMAVIAVNVLFCSLSSQICLQFKKIQREIIEMEIGDNRGLDCRRIKQLIIKHQYLIELSTQLDTIYTLPMFLNFISSSFIICLSGFLAMVSGF